MVKLLSFAAALLPQRILSPFNSALTSSDLLFKSVHDAWPMQKYYTETFQAPTLRITRTNEATSPGYLFFAPTGADALTVSPLIMTDGGELVWHGGGDPNSSKNNFKVQYADANNTAPVLSWWQGTMLHTFGHGYGSLHLLDSRYQNVRTFCPDSLRTRTTDGKEYPCHLDMHESFLTGRGTVIVTAYNVTQADMRSVGGLENGWIWDSQFYEFELESGREVFRWTALDHLKEVPLAASMQPLVRDGVMYGSDMAHPWDYFHINSVQPLEDGAYLVNARATWSFYKVDHTGMIEWHVQGRSGGDFEFDRAANFSWQHEPRVAHKTEDGYHIHLYDNANSEADPIAKPTRGLLLDIDVTHKQVKLLRALQDPGDVVVSKSQGSYQSLPENHVLLGYGQVAKIREFNAAGKNVYTAQFGPIGEGVHDASYRAYRFQWDGQPAAKPKVVASPAASGKTAVYMSWNGATRHDSWALFSGNSTDQLHATTAVIRKDGFETRFTISSAPKYVRVEARRGSEALGISDIVKI